MRKLLGRIIHRMGYQIKKFPDKDMVRRNKIINHCGINILFDIGANAGQYATKMRKSGYNWKIVSFEPLESAFKVLQMASLKDDNWIVNNYAIGNIDGKSVINVAGNSQSSSILEMLPRHLKSAPESAYFAKEEIEVRKLDIVIHSFCNPDEDRIMLKIDTQGFERYVLEGASGCLNQIRIIQLEMSIVPLYDGEVLYSDMIKYLDGKGFQLYSLENGFSDPVTGQILQVDGIFVNKAVDQ